MLRKPNPKTLWLSAGAIPVAVLTFVMLCQTEDRKDSGEQTKPSSSPPVAAAPTSAHIPSPVAQKTQARPLPVATSTRMHDWTKGDGMETGVITKIACNPVMLSRMVEENDRIKRRQLVYRNDPAINAVQRAKADGEPLQTLTLPGLDGQELEFEILRADLDPSGTRGTFSGRLAGKPNSMVILSFKGEREAFSVASPDDGLHLQVDPREPGEVIVKLIDPDTYVQGLCGADACNH